MAMGERNNVNLSDAALRRAADSYRDERAAAGTAVQAWAEM